MPILFSRYTDVGALRADKNICIHNMGSLLSVEDVAGQIYPGTNTSCDKILFDPFSFIIGLADQGILKAKPR